MSLSLGNRAEMPFLNVNIQDVHSRLFGALFYIYQKPVKIMFTLPAGVCLYYQQQHLLVFILLDPLLPVGGLQSEIPFHKTYKNTGLSTSVPGGIKFSDTNICRLPDNSEFKIGQKSLKLDNLSIEHSIF